MYKARGQRSKSSGETATVERKIKATGKATEKDVAFLLRNFYGSRVEIIRLPDKYDTGKHEDTRPSDFIVILSAEYAELNGVSNTFYIEAKETKADKTSWNLNSTFQKAQIQAMIRADKLKIPYFVVFQYLQTRKMYLVPSSVILDIYTRGGKSISKETIQQHPWLNGSLYTYDFKGKTTDERNNSQA